MNQLKKGEANMDMDWSATFAVVITGLVIVFAALIGLVIILYLSGKIVPLIDKIGKKKSTEPEAKQAEPVGAVPVKAAFVPPVGPGPVVEAAVEDGIPAKTVAAITAAVTTALEGQGSYAVKSIKRSDKK
jgi:Na+-transporting methylmalonyl-CoA/oxaloacetate decarboxylase gamma subunit